MIIIPEAKVPAEYFVPIEQLAKWQYLKGSEREPRVDKLIITCQNGHCSKPSVQRSRYRPSLRAPTSIPERRHLRLRVWDSQDDSHLGERLFILRADYRSYSPERSVAAYTEALRCKMSVLLAGMQRHEELAQEN